MFSGYQHTRESAIPAPFRPSVKKAFHAPKSKKAAFKGRERGRYDTRRISSAPGAVFTLLLAASGLFLQYISARSKEVPPYIAEYRAPGAPVDDVEAPAADTGTEPAIGQPGDDSYSPEKATEPRPGNAGDENAAEGGLPETQADYQRALQEEDNQVNACRLLLFIVCGVCLSGAVQFLSGYHIRKAQTQRVAAMWR